jgi:hypothetical protein
MSAGERKNFLNSRSTIAIILVMAASPVVEA